MALTEYPTTSWDTFCSLADAEALLLANVPTSQRTLWDAPLANADKEIQLRQATLLIKQRITVPDTLEDDLKLATALLANSSININMQDEDGKTGNIKSKRIEGVVDTEYFAPSADSNSFPDLVVSLLEQYNGESDGSFTFNRS